MVKLPLSVIELINEYLNKIYTKELNNNEITGFISFSGHNSFITNGQSTKLWNIKNDIMEKKINTKYQSYGPIAFSPNGLLFAFEGTNNNSNIIAIFHISGRLYKILNIDSYCRYIKFSSDNLSIIFISNYRFVNIWCIKTGVCIKTYDIKINNGFATIVVSANEKYMIPDYFHTNDIYLYNLDIGPTIVVKKFIGHESYVLTIAFSPDEKQIISGSQDSTIKIWDISTNLCVRTISSSIIGRIVTYNPNYTIGRILTHPNNKNNIVYFCAGIIKLIYIPDNELEPIKLTTVINEPKKEIYNAVFSPNGDYIAYILYGNLIVSYI
jgi:WD40 repeat protein